MVQANKNLWQEVIAYVSLSMLGAAALYAYVHDLSFLAHGSDANQKEMLAEATQIRNSVRYKRANVIFWSDAKAQQQLAHGDQIFTDGSSQAELKFMDGSSVTLGERSLIRIEDRGTNPSINLLRGQVVAAKIMKTSNSSGLTLKVGQMELRAANGADLQISMTGAIPKVVVLSGKAELAGATEAKAEFLKADSATIELSPALQANARVSTFKTRLMQPFNGEQIRGFQQFPISFQWESSDDAATVLEVSRDPDFKSITWSKSTTEQSAQTTFSEEGTYFWRVRPQQSDQEKTNGPNWAGLQHEFSLHKHQPIKILWPPERYQASLSPGSLQAAINISWLSSSLVEFQIQVAREESFLKPLGEYLIKGTNHSDLKLGKGQYYWRLRARDMTRKQLGPWSRARAIVIQEAQSFRQEISESPPSGASDLLNALKEKSLSAYPLPVESLSKGSAQDGKFDQTLPTPKIPPATASVSSGLSQALRSWNPIPAPMLAVIPSQAVNQMPRVSPTSRAGPKPVPLPPTVKWQLQDPGIDLGKGVLATITLSGDPRAKAYDLEAAVDAGFQKTILTTQLDRRVAKKLLSAGKYYVRARTLTKDDQIGPWSPSAQVLIPHWQPLPGPVLSTRGHSPFYRKSIPRPFLELTPPPLSPDEEYQGVVVAIADADDFSEGSTMSTRAKQMPVTLAGEHTYIRAQMIDQHGKAGNWSEVLALQTKRVEDKPKLVAPSSKEKILFPYLDKKLVQFRWTQPEDVHASELIVARDPELRDIVFRKTTNQQQFASELTKDSQYYWQIVQKSHPEGIELRTEVQSFATKTLPLPPVDRAKLPHELYAGYGLSLIDYQFEDANYDSLIEDSWANSLFLAYSYWMSTTWGFEIDLMGHALSVTYASDDQTQSSEKQTLMFLDASFLTRVLWELSREQGLRLEGLFGVSANTLAKMVTADEGLSSRSYQPLHVWNGVGVLYAITPSIFFNPRLEAGIPVYLDNGKVKEGLYIRGIVRALQRLPRLGANLSYGLMGEHKSYEIEKDGKREKIGSLLRGVLLGLGKDF